MRELALLSLVTLLLVPFAFADSRAIEARPVLIIQSFSVGAGSQMSPIVPGARPNRSGNRREGVFRYDGRAWNYWLGDGQKCWGMRRYPQCS